MCGSRWGGGHRVRPLKNHKNIGFSSNTSPDPLKNCSYLASTQYSAIIGMPAKCHLMAFRWQADDGLLIVVLGSSLPSSTKKQQKKTLSKLDPLSQNFLDPQMPSLYLWAYLVRIICPKFLLQIFVICSCPLQ